MPKYLFLLGSQVGIIAFVTPLVSLDVQMRLLCLKLISASVNAAINGAVFLVAIPSGARILKHTCILYRPMIQTWAHNNVCSFLTVGKTSNYAVVMAQLIINGKKHGMHAFMCQLRDLEDHRPMPGIVTVVCRVRASRCMWRV